MNAVESGHELGGCGWRLRRHQRPQPVI